MYSGRMDYEGMALRLLLDLLELLNLMNLPSQFYKVETFTLQSITNGKYPLSECLRSLDVSSKMGMQSVGEALLTLLGSYFTKISEMAEVGELTEAMIIRLLEEKNEKKKKTILRL